MVPDLCYGRLDVPLAESASAEIAAVCARLTAVERVITSPARRCLQLADEVVRRFDARLDIEAALLELDFGDWEGLRWREIDRAAIEAWAADPWGYRPGGGESLAELWQRVSALVRRLALPGLDAAPSSVLLVAHHGPLRVLHCLGAGYGPERFFEATFDFGAAGLRAWVSTR